MASIHEIKHRIESIREIRQITSAMKLISASRLKKAQQQLNQTLPYYRKVEATMADILTHSGKIENVYFEDRWDKVGKRTGLILITGEKGLAGGYNTNIIKLCESLIRDAENPVLFVLGQVGRRYFINRGYELYEPFDYPFNEPSIKLARIIADKILELFRNEFIDEVYMAFTEMVSSLVSEPLAIKLLPLSREMLLTHFGADPNIIRREVDDIFQYDPSPGAVFDLLIPKFLKGVIYTALVEAYTSELSARMTAMDSATTNADEMIKELDLLYNRARQSSITQEISEIVGGASAV